MRDLDLDELTKLLEWGECPFCDGKVFHFGPRGAAALNIFCVQCEAGYNVVVPKLPAQLIKAPKL